MTLPPKNYQPEDLPTAWRALRCFEPYGEEAEEYAHATAALVPESCEKQVVALLAELRRRAPASAGGDEREAHFVAEQNAYVVKNAESYYQAMVRGGPESWNVRDRHMTQTLRKLLDHHGLPPRWWTYGSLAWNDWVWALTERMACGCVRYFPGARRQRRPNQDGGQLGRVIIVGAGPALPC